MYTTQPRLVMAFNSFSYVVLFFLCQTAWSSTADKAKLIGNRLDVYDCERGVWLQKASTKPDVKFRVRVSTDSDRYAPEKEYEVYLESTLPGSKFTEFYLVVHSLNNTDSGRFEIRNDGLSRLTITCPNTVIQASYFAKTHIAVGWRAPPVDSGCVVISGAVLDSAGEWHHGGDLSMKLCQGELDGPNLPEILDICEACDEASYHLEFEGLWSRQTHPEQFPKHHFDTGFSAIIGASHTNNFRLWEYNKNASEGIANLAETANSKELEKELKFQSTEIRTVIKAKELKHPFRNDKTYAMFRTDDKHHLVSLIAKITPSSDWVVGISGLELCLKNKSWATSKVVNLLPIDVGTADGKTYEVPYVRTIPPAAVRLISPTEDHESVFYSSSKQIEPMAKVTITRQRVFGKSECITKTKGDFPRHSPYSECAVTNWANYGACNCKERTQLRRRNFVRYQDKYNDECKKLIVTWSQEIPCYNAQCDWYSSTPITDYTSDSTSGPPPLCEMTEWSAWSECKCGSSYSSRYRKYKYTAYRKICTFPLMEKKTCTGTPPCSTPNYPCAVTLWSEWSPCDAPCGVTMGKRLRTRLYLNPGTAVRCNELTAESQACESTRTDCNGDPQRICYQPKEYGQCPSGYFIRWYYDISEGRCAKFVYSGCRGNRNNFRTYAECKSVCGEVYRVPSYTHIPQHTTTSNPDLVIDCKLSEWSEWSECSSTCGHSSKIRRRTVEINAQNGGELCPRQLTDRKKCRRLPPCGQRR